MLWLMQITTWNTDLRPKMVRPCGCHDILIFTRVIELIDSYLNGSRTLSSDRLSYLIVSQGGTSLPSPPLTPRSTSPFDERESPSYNYDIMICAAHFLGDGMALHQFANDFFGLLGSEKTIAELEAQLKEELSSRWGTDSTRVCISCVVSNLAE